MSAAWTVEDRRFMAMALALGQRTAGRTHPNPAVGCVLVNGGRVVGRGWTQPGGRPHAETMALARAGEAARGSTAYVTLEPCANWGQTSACALGLIEAGVARVVVGCRDPDPRVDGQGLAWLERAGVAVELGCEADACRAAHAGLVSRIGRGRPFTALKLALSLDGRIALPGGRPLAITGAAAQAVGHGLRAQHDAILVGSGTALADDPLLTCRLPGLSGASPIRVVLDGQLRLGPESRLAQTAREVPLWVLARPGADAEAAAALERLGARVVAVPGEFAATLAWLAGEGITRLLVEGGAAVATAALSAGLVDRLHLFTGPMLLGGQAPAATLALPPTLVAAPWRIVLGRPISAGRPLVLEPGPSGGEACSPAS